MTRSPVKTKPYSNRELDSKFKNLEDTLTKNHAETVELIKNGEKNNDSKHSENTNRLKEIAIQTTATNGRVRKLEKWQAGLIMAGSVAVAMGMMLIGLLAYIWNFNINLQSTTSANLQTQIQNLQQK